MNNKEKIYAKPVRIFNDPISERLITTCSNCQGKVRKNDLSCKHCGALFKDKGE